MQKKELKLKKKKQGKKQLTSMKEFLFSTKKSATATDSMTAESGHLYNLSDRDIHLKSAGGAIITWTCFDNLKYLHE